MATQNVFGKRGTQKAATEVSSRAKKAQPFKEHLLPARDAAMCR